MKPEKVHRSERPDGSRSTETPSSVDFRAVFKALSDPCLILDPDLRIVAVNDSYLRSSMTKREEIVGRGIFEVFPDNPDDPHTQGVRDVTASLKRVLKSGLPDTLGLLKYDIPKPAAEGGGFEERYWSTTNVPVMGKDGKVAYIIHSTQDVTEYVRFNLLGDGDPGLGSEELRRQTKRMEAEIYARSKEVADINQKLKRANEELEQTNQELEAFNHMVSHDLRQPLNIIATSCQAISMACATGLSDQCRKYLEYSYSAVGKMNDLIEALLSFSRSAHAKLRREPIDLSMMAKSIAAEIRLTDPQREVRFKIPEGIVANGDRNLLHSVLENLIGNAWKYTGMRKEAEIEFGVTAGGDEPAYFIRDNGKGFDMAEADKLFVPFSRLAGADKFRGFGIGLGTVERIIRRHGGRVWAEGIPDKGATFYFTLPARE